MNHFNKSMSNNSISVSQGEEKKDFDFGWSKVAMNMHWVLGVLALIVVAVHSQTYPGAPLASVIPALIGMMLFIGSYNMRISHKQESITLPYVDLFGENTGGPILDVGCGSGRSTLAVSKVSGDRMIVALDRFDASYIQGGGNTLIERNTTVAGISDRVHIVKGDAEKIDCEDNLFDAAVSSNALDHSNRKIEILKEVNRVLKPQGKFLLMVMVPNFFTYSIAGPLCHVFAGKKAWKELFKQSGFRELEGGSINNCAYFLLEKGSV